MRQEQVRPLAGVAAPARGAVSAAIDAAGAVDGLKTGRYGFHTDLGDKPWWQVDLQESRPLEYLLIYNRSDDAPAAARAARIMVLLSADGRQWSTAYQHNGQPFRGEPLRVTLAGQTARFVRLQLPGKSYLHLDEVEVYALVQGQPANVALKKPALQSSASAWSTRKDTWQRPQAATLTAGDLAAATVRAIERGRLLAESLRRLGARTEAHAQALEQVARQAKTLPADAPFADWKQVYFQARWAIRKMALTNPLLDFNDLVFVKRVPGSFTHMSDQYYGWFSRPGGGLYVLAGFKTDAPRLRCLTEALPAGSALRPDLSADGRRVLFAYCKHYPGLADEKDKLDKSHVPEDAFYHLYEAQLDGSGVRRLTHGKYDDFDGRYLPDGRIVFLSTRRGRSVQCTQETADERQDGAGADCYVRCGGGLSRPVAVYTLHVMDSAGGKISPLSPFEMFEWTPSIDHQGRIIYARWDYVDRSNMPYMKLWATMPDGTNPQALYGNFTRNPHTMFEVRAIPGSHKFVFTAGGHHAQTGGSLVLVDPRQGVDNEAAMRRLTPEVCFAESEGWPQTYFGGPYPLSEEHYLVSWSDRPLPPGVPPPGWGLPGAANDLGLYLFDVFGNLELLYRDPTIGSETPLPVKTRSPLPQIAAAARSPAPSQGAMFLADVYQGLPAAARGSIRSLRLVGVPPKTHPTMNFPNLGLTRDDPGKFVLGTVPVEPDGSAHFHVPAGVTLFFQALDARGLAVQTMRSGVYVQPGQTYSCIGCHEHRGLAPPGRSATAAVRGPSKITPGPEGSWPLDYQVLVQPVLDRQCVSCHRPQGTAPKSDLTAAKSYETLTNFGEPSLAKHVRARYAEGRSMAGAGAAQTNPLIPLLDKGHYDVRLSSDDWHRLFVWMDTYGQRLGSFDQEQERELRRLRSRMAALLEP